MVNGSQELAPHPDIEKSRLAMWRAVQPGMIALVLVDAKIAHRHRTSCEGRNDDADMACAGDHRIGAVGFALNRAAAMCVHVGNNGQAAFAANGPQLGECRRMKHAHASLVGAGLKIVVEYEGLYNTLAVDHLTKQEYACLVASFAAAIEFGHGRSP